MKKAPHLSILVICLQSVVVFADFPSKPGMDPWTNRPNDPYYTSTWNYFSHLPPDHVGKVSELEKQMGSGIHVDEAWQYHTGSPETAIAVLDSGTYWDHLDLIDRFYLNKDELPLPMNSTQYDANGDGRFSASDYQNDSRVKDINNNRVVDPQDLIAAFSDGIDDDRNGYMDDICGWDFHENDNDPHDRVLFGHGVAEALISVAALNNKYSYSGICGDCSLIPIRVNDSFVVDANAFAKAVVFSVDSGAKLIQQALGSANWNQNTIKAINYAYDHNVVIIGTAADENSYHHNFPSTLDPIVYTNAIRYDTKAVKDASTFVNHNNCSNYGARMEVSTSARACSSEATAVLAGAVGLTISYANSLNVSLTPGETISLIKSTATDINLGPNDNEPYRHSTYQGWDMMTGYGRTDAGEMLKAVHDQKIPPEARITAPAWFELFRFGKDQKFDVVVQINNARSKQLQVVLELAKGVETADSDFVVMKTLDLAGDQEFSDIIASINLNDLKTLKPNLLDKNQYQFAYTLRLRVKSNDGLMSEARRTIFAFDDPMLKNNFPINLKNSAESGGFFADINRDKKDEFIAADSNGFIHAFKEDGTELEHFPVVMPPSQYDLSLTHDFAPLYASIVSPLAGGDINNDGFIEIIAVSVEGHILVINYHGQVLKGFPVKIPQIDKRVVNSQQIIANGFLSSPVIVDFDQDGFKDILVAGLDGQIHAYNHNGKSLAGFPMVLDVNGKRAKIISSPSVIDVNGDGILDLVVGTNHFGQDHGYIFAINGTSKRLAKNLAGFPVRIPMLYDKILPTIGTGIPASPVIGDIDGDDQNEIVIHPFVGKTYVISSEGTIKRSLDMTVPNGVISDRYMISGFGQPALGDIDGDGILDPVGIGAGSDILTSIMVGGKRIPFHHLVTAWDGKTGNMFPQYPKVAQDMMIAASPALADLNGDKKAEIIIGSGGYFLHGFSFLGEISGFPHFTGGWISSSPSLGDIDGDGLIEIAATTREGYVFIWDTETPVKNNIYWSTFKGGYERKGVISPLNGERPKKK